MIGHPDLDTPMITGNPPEGWLPFLCAFEEWSNSVGLNDDVYDARWLV